MPASQKYLDPTQVLRLFALIINTLSLAYNRTKQPLFSIVTRRNDNALGINDKFSEFANIKLTNPIISVPTLLLMNNNPTK